MNAHDKEAAERESLADQWKRELIADIKAQRDGFYRHVKACKEGGWYRGQMEQHLAVLDSICAALSSPAEAGGKAQPFAYFQRNPGWNTWEEVIPAAAGEDGVVAAYLAPPTAQPMTFEEICLLICQHTGKRINIPVDQIEDMAEFARAIEEKLTDR